MPVLRLRREISNSDKSQVAVDDRGKVIITEITVWVTNTMKQAHGLVTSESSPLVGYGRCVAVTSA